MLKYPQRDAFSEKTGESWANTFPVNRTRMFTLLCWNYYDYSNDYSNEYSLLQKSCMLICNKCYSIIPLFILFIIEALYFLGSFYFALRLLLTL